jgi:alpha-tubulin suppressor-like RCC1 family protein
MARTTGRTRLARFVRRLAPAAVAAVLLVLGCLGATASARTAGGASPAKNEAPKITKQPVSVTVDEGQSASFEATASGNPAPTVRWEVSTNGGKLWRPLNEDTEDRLTIPDTTISESGYEYEATFTSNAGQVTSKPATLTVQTLPAVTGQPASVTVDEGQSASFEATASGFPAPTVQWEVSTNSGATWKAVSGATADRLTIAAAKTSENGDEYRAAFENAAGRAVSNSATLNVHRAPEVTKQPQGASVEEGQSATFEASASGVPAPTVQWEVSSNGGGTWTPVAGATSDQLTIASTRTGESGDELRAVFVNAAGSATSAAATLSVHKLPTVTTQPAGTTVEVGQSAVFEAAASGFPAPSVQWELSTNGGGSWSAVAGATSDRLTVADAAAAESGDEYRAVFTNVAGKATSEAATLTVATHHYRVLAWGQNSSGQLGDGNFNQSDLPVSVSGLNFVTSIAAGRRHSLALLSNGTVMAWGGNSSGQLGDGEVSYSGGPVAVEKLSDVVAIAAGSNWSLALLGNGTVMAWGGNEDGQLGDGGTEESDVPVPVKGLTGVTAISAGGEQSLALLGDGKVMAWGANEHGQLGDGGTKDSNVPVQVKGLTGVTAISAGGEHSLALMSDGTVMAWGDDEYGQLGNSTVKERGEEEERLSEVPVPVTGLSGVTSISAGARFSLALLGDGTAMAWGSDEDGQLGDGVLQPTEETPGAVSGLSEVAEVSAAGQHSMALMDNGTVMTWGEGKMGELGNGTASERSDVPVLVSGLSQARGIAAGGAHDLAYSEPLPSVTALSATVGGVDGGTPVTIAGVNFEGVTAVDFGANAASFTVDSPTSITAVAPAGALGTVNVTVTTPAGTSPVVPADRFTYVPSPTVTKLSTKSGPGGGATTVTITGENLAEVEAVAFGANAASEFRVNSSTSITAVSPAGAGVVNVTVTSPAGTSAIAKHDEFSYAPAVGALAPDSGTTAGGTLVTVTGAGFAPGDGTTAFKFGSKLATSVECASTTSCTLLTPAAKKAGTVTVIAEVGKLKSASDPPANDFIYE